MPADTGWPAEKSAAFQSNMEEAKHVEMRMWCIGQSAQLAIALTRSGVKETLDVMAAADEMYEFLMTGAARTHKKSTGKVY